MADFEWAIDARTRPSFQPLGFEVAFGGGVEQFVRNGVGRPKEVWQISTPYIDIAELEAIHAFLIAKDGQPFTWVPPALSAGTVHVRCPKWEPTFEEGVLTGLTAEFRRVYVT